MTFNGSECCKINFNVRIVNGISFVKCPKTRLKPFALLVKSRLLKKKTTLQTSPVNNWPLEVMPHQINCETLELSTFHAWKSFEIFPVFMLLVPTDHTINCKLINSLLFYLEFRLGLVHDDLWFTGN